MYHVVETFCGLIDLAVHRNLFCSGFHFTILFCSGFHFTILYEMPVKKSDGIVIGKEILVSEQPAY